MKVFAINSSPRGGGQSKTEWILDRLVEGMRDAGADVDVVALRKKKVNFCIGCFTCWTKTPGICVHKDDMTKELFPKYIEADLTVFASPLYHYTLNAQMKAFIERTLPVLQPFFEQRDGKTRHPLRHKVPAAVTVSVAGFPEDSVFDQLSHYMRFMFKDRLWAEIYRAGAESLMMGAKKDVREKIANAVQQAGRELVTQKAVTTETLTQIKQPLIKDKGSFREMGNLFWKTCIAEGVTPREFEKKGLFPRPDSIASFMALLKMGFNPAEAKDISAVMEYHFSGAVQGACHFKIADGTIKAIEGPCQQPDLTIDTPFDLWIDIMAGKADGQEMFMAQKYKVEGDFNLLMKMEQLFGSGKTDTEKNV